MIRFVYFDLGNVLVGFSHARAVEQLARLSGQPEPVVQHVLFDSGLQWEYERGELDTPSCCQKLRERLGFFAPDAAIVRALSDIFWPVPEMVPLLMALAAVRFPFGVLSNTCDAHWQWVTERTMPWLGRCGCPCVLSFREGVAKPDAAIYHRATQAAGTPADATFFVDDRTENVAAARQAGWKAEVFTGALQLRQDLARHGLLL